MNRTVVVTGGSGFIGTNLVAHFPDRGRQVTNLDIAPPRNRAHFTLWQKVNLLNREQVIEAIRSLQPEELMHFGARTDLSERENLVGHAANMVCYHNALELARA